jgi:hypothetical protein
MTLKHYHVTLVFKDATQPDAEWLVNHPVEAENATEAIDLTDAMVRGEVSLGFDEDNYVSSSQVQEYTPG